MIGYLRDYANAISAVGYVFAVVALFLVLNGNVELGVAAMLWTWFLDHWDGHVARKTMHRRAPEVADFGKCFDGFCDFIHGVIFPAVVIMLLGDGSALSLIASIILVLAGSTRLAYFENVGLTSDAKFAGIPVSYDTPMLAILLLLRPAIPSTVFADVLAIAFIILAVLHVSTAIRVTAIRGRAVPVATICAVVASAALTLIPVAVLSN